MGGRSGGDTNKIYLAGHTFHLTNQIAWTTEGLTVRGGHAATNAADKPGPSDPGQWPTVLTRSGAFDHRILHLDGANDSTLENVTITGGNVIDGAGLRIENSQDVLLSNCIVENNAYSKEAWFTTLAGGGIYASSSTLTLTNCLVRGNVGRQTAGGDGRNRALGGGIWSDGILTVRDSKILNNSTFCARLDNGRGGGVYFDGTELRMKNVVIANNYADHFGDGIEIAGGTAVLLNCTVYNNHGHGILGNNNIINVTNSIVWNNITDIAGSSITISYSNIGNEDYETYGEGNMRVDPRFEYGYYLATDSPCIGEGSDTAHNLGMQAYVRNMQGETYDPEDTINLGYHYTSGFDVIYPDLYVASDGDDENDGTTPEDALRTITKALTLAHAGTHIHVATGEYSVASGEIFPLTLADVSHVRIQGTNAARTVIDPGSDNLRVMVLERANGTMLQGLTISGGTENRGAGLRIIRSADVFVSGCIVENNAYSQGIVRVTSFGAGIYAWHSIVTITNSLVRDNVIVHTSASDPLNRARGGGIWSDGILTIRDSKFLNNSTLSSRPDNGRGGGVYFDGVELRMKNVLIANNYADHFGDGIEIESGTAVLLNCTVYNNHGHGIFGNNNIINVTNSIVWSNINDIEGSSITISYSNIGNEDYETYGEGNMRADPRFEYGYYLADNSPCIGQGSDTAHNLGMQAYVRNIQGETYDTQDTINLGYHYTSGFDVIYPDLYVASDGDDENDGTTPEDALRTITKALTLAHAGTHIHVATGEYSVASGEIFPLTLADVSHVRIQGTNAARTVIDPGSDNLRVMVLERANYAMLQGLTISGGAENHGAGLRIIRSADVFVSGCIVENNAYSQGIVRVISFGAGIYASSSIVTITNSLVRGNVIAHTSASDSRNRARAGGIWSDGILTVRDSKFLNNSTLSARADNGVGGGVYFDGVELRMKNVLIANNYADHFGDGLEIAGGTFDLANLTIADNDGQGVRRVNGAGSLINSIVWNHGEDIVGEIEVSYSIFDTGAEVIDGGNNINADPLFVDVAEGDYRLQHGSPAIDTGLNQAWMVGATDLNGNPRILMGTVDMGCYETIPPTGTLFFMR